MQVTDFINSETIVRYLQDINYVFSPLEEAFIAVQSRRWLYGKTEFLRQLVASTEDFAITGQNFTFHELLNGQLDVWNNLTARFADEGVWKGFAEDDSQMTAPSTCLDAVVAATYRALRQEHNCCYIEKYLAGGGKIVATLDRNMHTTNIEYFGENESPYSKFFKTNFFVLPVPFRRGDIVGFRQGRVRRRGAIADAQCIDFVSGKMYSLEDMPLCYADRGVKWYQFAPNGDILAAAGLPRGVNYLDLEMAQETFGNQGDIQREFARTLRGDGNLALLLNCQLRQCGAMINAVRRCENLRYDKQIDWDKYTISK